MDHETELEDLEDGAEFEERSTGPDWAWDFARPLEERGHSHLVRVSTNDTEAGTTLFCASKPTPDRAMDVVASSWLLKDFRANPVILDNHSHMRVVGQATEVRVPKDGDDAGCLMLRVKWDQDSPDPSVRNVGHQHLTGVRRAGSVGFRSKKKTKRDKLPTDHAFYQEPIEVETWWGREKLAGWLFEHNVLMEFSSATVPMHPEALQRSLGLGPRDDKSVDKGAVHDFRQWLVEHKAEAMEILWPTMLEKVRKDDTFRRLLRAALDVGPPADEQPFDFAAAALRALEKS